jgi:aminoacylase
VKLNGDLGSVNSINITMLNTGKQHNVIPETAEATVDIRISPNFSLKELEDKINDFTNINGIKWNFSLKHDSSTISSIDPTNPYWSSIHQAIIERYNFII